MKLYTSGGIREFSDMEFLLYVHEQDLNIEIGKILSLRILERKLLSNKGNATDGRVLCEDGMMSFGLNIGGNPIGTGWKYYIPFLEEMRCKKRGHLYDLKSLVGEPLPYVVCGNRLRGYVTPKDFVRYINNLL
jgi:hypothetical protein